MNETIRIIRKFLHTNVRYYPTDSFTPYIELYKAGLTKAEIQSIKKIYEMLREAKFNWRNSGVDWSNELYKVLLSLLKNKSLFNEFFATRLFLSRTSQSIIIQHLESEETQTRLKMNLL